MYRQGRPLRRSRAGGRTCSRTLFAEKRKKKFECWFESLTPEYLVLQDLEPAAGEDLGTEALNWSWDLKEAEAGHMPSPVLLDWHAIPRFLLSDAAV